MPIPILIGIGVLLAGGYGVKKGIDGHNSHSEADEIIGRAKRRYNDQKSSFDDQEKNTQKALEQLGTLELDIGAKFDEFQRIVEDLLKKLNQGRQNKLEINLPKHQLEKIENYTFTALGVLGSVAGAGVAGTAAGFAVYGGVMTFAAASTGTAISALSGAAATNATLAAIGGGALSAGGLGMAGGTAILGAAVAAPVLAIAGWAYASHGEEALRNAKKARDEADTAIEKLSKAEQSLQRIEEYAGRLHMALEIIYSDFQYRYLEPLREAHRMVLNGEELPEEENELSKMIGCGYALAAILINIITTPLFKVMQDGDNKSIKDKDGMPIMEKDSDGSMILNASKIDEVIKNQNQEFNALNQK